MLYRAFFIISQQAGQCIVCARSVRVTFGQVDKNGGPISWVTDVNHPDHIKYHQDYNPWDFANNPFVNDIGLVYLEEALEPILIPYVWPVDYSRNVNQTYVGFRSYAMGFGGVSFPSTILNFVDLSVITNVECSEVFTDVITDGNLCTYTENGKSTCQGDAGGPLVIEYEGGFLIIGVGSFRHRAGCNLGHPAVFTRITYFVEWLEEIIGSPPGIAPPVPPPADEGCQCYCSINGCPIDQPPQEGCECHCNYDSCPEL